MKYIVTAINIKRKGYEVHSFEDGNITQDEIIDTETNKLFQDCKDLWEIEDRYESFWNRLGDGYENHEIVKVLNVSILRERESITKKGKNKCKNK